MGEGRCTFFLGFSLIYFSLMSAFFFIIHWTVKNKYIFGVEREKALNNIEARNR